MCITTKNLPLVANNFRLEVFAAIAQLPSDEWDNIVGEEHFYASSAHLAAVELTLSKEIQPLYILVYAGNEPIAAIYFQLISFHFVNAIKNFRPENGGFRKKILYQFLNLFSETRIPLLQSGNIFFTGDNGIYVRPEISEPVKMSILTQVMEYEVWNNVLEGKVKASLFNNLGESTQVKGLSELAFYDFQTEPDLWMEIRKEWTHFFDYVDALSSKYRVRLKKVMEKSSLLEITEISEYELSTIESELLKLYKQVSDHSAFNMALLREGYFVAMKVLYGDLFLVKAYRLEGKLVGFSSGFLVDDIYHVHFIGLDYAYNEAHSIYHRMLFEFVREAIDNKKTGIHFGRTATEIKTTIGAEPIPMHGYLRFEKKWANKFLPSLLKNFGGTPYVQRHPFKK